MKNPWAMRAAMGIVLACLAGLSALAGCEPPTLDPLPPPDDLQYTDAWITRQVILRLNNDLDLHKFYIHVQTVESVVYLQGALPSEHLRQRAEQLAAGGPYVQKVRNNIIVTAEPPEEDP